MINLIVSYSIYTEPGCHPVKEANKSFENPKNGRIAELIKRQSRKIEQLDIYALPLIEETTSNVKHCKYFVFGKPEIGKKGPIEKKTILMMGCTAPGKRNLINGLINYILGVEWNDSFRFQLVEEKSEDSKETDITIYEIHPMDGSRLSFVLTLVDTPVITSCDTRDSDRDQTIKNNISQFFFEQDYRNIVKVVDAFGLVLPKCLKHFPGNLFAMNSMLSIFDKKLIRDKINFFVTNADDWQQQFLLDFISMSKIPCRLDGNGEPQYFKFSEWKFFTATNNPIDKSAKLNNMFWNTAMDNFKNFISHLHVPSMDERKRPGLTFDELQPMINQEFEKLEQLRKIRLFIATNVTNFEVNDDVFNVEVNVGKKINWLNTKQGVTIKCKMCHVTSYGEILDICREEENELNIRYPRDPNNSRHPFFMMLRFRKCPNLCFWSENYNQISRFEYLLVNRKISLAFLHKKFGTASTNELSEALRKQMEERLSDLLELFKAATNHIQRLEEIAGCRHPCSTLHFIDLMISNEEKIDLFVRDHCHLEWQGFEERIISLREARRLAELDLKKEIIPQQLNRSHMQMRSCYYVG